MSKIKEYILPILIGLCALAVSASAAIYSVTGLSKLFAGASMQVMIMAGSLEVAKLVIATLLHQYWNSLNKLLRVYLTTSVVVLVLITSMGIYGFLSSAYQNTAVGFQTAGKEISFLKQKEAFYQKDLDRYDEELNRISNNISELSKAKAREVSVSDGRGGVTTSVSTTELRLADSRIRSEETNRTSTLASRNIVADSLKNIQTKILNLEVQASSNAELGPLIYLSELTGKPMDQIINILLLVIIFVFDPLAISLVLAANFAFDRIKYPEVKAVDNKPKEITLKEKTEAKKIGKKRKVKNKKPKRVSRPTKIEQMENVKEDVEPETEKIDQILDQLEQIPPDQNDIPDLPLEDVKNITLHQTPPEDIFDEEYTGQPIPVDVKIGKILQKTPTYVSVLLNNGERRKLTKQQYTDYMNQNKINIKKVFNE